MTVQTSVIQTRVPARLDRLPWSRFHWLVVIGLGTVWIMDGLEVTMVGSVASRLTEKGSGIELSAANIGTAAAVYVIGACVGALFFGQLTDRFGRKKLFLLTLALYIAATTSTAFAFSPAYFYAARFFTGAGIGGEYAAINSAIDELIPARVRGRVDLIINGSYWVGSAAGAAAAIFFLDESIFPKHIGWRITFGIGAILGLLIMLVRRNVPESPRWLFIHGQEERAEAIVDGIERDVREETGQELEEPGDTLTVRQREAIPFKMIAQTAFKLYPKRSVLGLALFVGQAFIYNGITFNLGTLYSTFYGITSSFVPVFIIVYAVGNFLGPLLLGRLFDTVGRIPMISGTYLGSAVMTIPLALVFLFDIGGPWALEGLVFVTFFLASAGASAAYLTVSEIFPMETRALAIAFFYAIGTAVGGISGPLLFGNLINSNERSLVTVAFFIGAAVMALGGITEIFFGVKAEQASLEDIAMPLTAQEAEEGVGREGAAAGTPAGTQSPDYRGEASQHRQEAEEARARAAEHRAVMRELEPDAQTGDRQAIDRREAEETLAEISELRARSHDEQAAAFDELAAAGTSDGEQEGAPGSIEDAERRGERSAGAAMERAEAARQRALSLSEQAEALAAENDAAAAEHRQRADDADRRARTHEQLARAEVARAAAAEQSGSRAALERAKVEMYERWARAEQHPVLEGADDDRTAAHAQARALAAEERVQAAEHKVAAEEYGAEAAKASAGADERAEAERREQAARELEERIRARIERRQQWQRTGFRRFRPGPSPTLAAARSLTVRQEPYMSAERALDHEIEVIARALHEHGATDRSDLARFVGARYWGPGRFRAALATAVEEGRVRRLSRRTFGPIEPDHHEDTPQEP